MEQGVMEKKKTNIGICKNFIKKYQFVKTEFHVILFYKAASY